jgi:hypothetical protein
MAFMLALFLVLVFSWGFPVRAIDSKGSSPSFFPVQNLSDPRYVNVKHQGKIFLPGTTRMQIEDAGVSVKIIERVDHTFQHIKGRR